MKNWKFSGKTKVNAFGKTLFQIEATADFGEVKTGDIGGWIEKEDNLRDEAWVFGSAEVFGSARVSGSARVFGSAEVSGSARVSDEARCLTFTGFGSVGRTTIAFKEADGGVRVNCGCFSGNIDKFKAKIKETHGDSLYAKEYLAIVEVIKMHFGLK